VDKYYVNNNAQNNGDHEVHKEGCERLAKIQKRTYLGEFRSCLGAVVRAKDVYLQSNGCYYCCKPCHMQR